MRRLRGLSAACISAARSTGQHGRCRNAMCGGTGYASACDLAFTRPVSPLVAAVPVLQLAFEQCMWVHRVYRVCPTPPDGVRAVGVDMRDDPRTRCRPRRHVSPGLPRPVRGAPAVYLPS